MKEERGPGKKNLFKDIMLTILVVFSVLLALSYFDKRENNDAGAIVLGEKDRALQDDRAFLESENFQTSIVSFGGNTAMPDNLREVKLKIRDVKSELLTTKDQEEVLLHVSWKTNKPATSEIEYGKNASQTKRIEKENKYDHIHSLTLSSLEPATAYVYKINGTDKWGNVESSENFAFYTGAPNVSLIDLLLGAFKDVFSWAVK